MTHKYKIGEITNADDPTCSYDFIYNIEPNEYEIAYIYKGFSGYLDSVYIYMYDNTSWLITDIFCEN